MFPIKGIYTHNQKELFNLLDQVRESKNVGIVVVTHDKSWASNADRTLNIKDGKWEV